ncbi:MAG: DUF1963 domain-containing protein [Candidatus Kapaibacterium sp.]
MKLLLILSQLFLITCMLFGYLQKTPNDNYVNKLAEFKQEIREYKWDDVKAIEDLVSEAITIESSKLTPIKIGDSKFGGTPDLPSKISWPKFNDKSMQFFGQLNLAEIAEFHRNILLPQKGFLYFFAYFPEPLNQFGAEYMFIKNKDEFAVIYFNGSISELKQTTFPSDIYEGYKFQSRKLSFETMFQLPATSETSIVERSSLSKKDRKLIYDFSHRFDDGIFDQILGYPIPIQHGVDYDWALSYLNINLIKDEIQRRKLEIEEIRPEFINLLTFPLFKPIGGSQVYIGILKKDLSNRDFSKAVFIMQDT